MYHIRLDGLDKDKAKRWLKRASEFLTADKVYAFISAWIVFNYYYCTHTVQNESNFNSWSRANNVRKGDRAELRLLVTQKKFQKLVKKFLSEETSIAEITFVLPVRTYHDRPYSVPNHINNTRSKLSELSVEDLFDIIYQIRNNLFHGRKDPDKDKRDAELASTAATFLVPFCSFLIDKTGP